jgi:fructokinase
MDPENHISFSIHRPAAFDAIGLCEKQFASLNQFKPDWIYFGTLAQTEPATERLVLQVLQSAPRARRFYDMNLRTGHWNLALVERLARLATVLKLNGSEAEILFREFLGDRPFNLEEFCRYCSSRFRAETVCVTLGGKGCAVFTKDTFAHFQGFAVDVVDTVGAGDAFAAAFLHGLDAQWPIERVARFANAVGAIVTTRAGAIPKWTLNECMQLLGSTSDPSAAPDVYDASSASGGAQR